MISESAWYRQCWSEQLRIGFALLGAVLLATSPHTSFATEVYRWSDLAGGIHFADAPPPDGRYEIVSIDDPGSTSIGLDSNLGPAGERAGREHRDELCVIAQRHLIRVARRALQRADTASPTTHGVTETAEPMPFELEPPVTDPSLYWTTKNKRWEFRDQTPDMAAKTYRRDIEANCRIGTAVEERQLASLNASIQESNCRLLRQHYGSLAVPDIHPRQERSTVKQLLKNSCG
jgi:hypothetical protein